jgi:hypothetical protein
MSKVLLLIFSLSLLFSCDNEKVLDIIYLKESGYKEVTCDEVTRYKNKSSTVVEVNKNLHELKSYLVARCFDKDSCLLNLEIKRKKIVCQRYISSIVKDYKGDYVFKEFKEFIDHRVLYISVDKEYEKDFTKRVN